ncbi:U5 small nuclear ribonucleoprotein 40 kDa protein-like isoform X2 [Schistocerca gregaria]|uniref:U5 small nuclear ribonucleoprotein 40 kDa protein-like isoform X2 n=1 Tax=Schistocerca gregaria TaxID=7010 RepID=UPI00211DBFE7|nr:U5 small nuclear ribonucleoprotein 40 kDa protein-like isoform X2 [Schistocerca gregaria]
MSGADVLRQKVAEEQADLVSSEHSKNVAPLSHELVKSSDVGDVSQAPSNSTGLLLAPTMLLTGHQSDVLSVKFSPDGKHLASGSRDKQIFLWNATGDCKNYMVLKGHKNAVVQIEWSSDSNIVYSASCDKTLGSWDAETGRCLIRLQLPLTKTESWF